MLYRLSKKPGKQLLYLLLLRDKHLSRGKKIGVDFGCKAFKNYPIFETQEYYGVDLDADALARGKATFPKGRAVHARIEHAQVPPADFALCVNVFHATNSKDWEPRPVLEKIISGVAPGGVLLINFQHKGDPEELVSLLRRSFQKVEIFRHGFKRPAGRWPVLILKITSAVRALAAIYLKREPARWTRIYCRCIGRLEEETAWDPSHPY
jgi:SAM-dependent methyltransferase